MQKSTVPEENNFECTFHRFEMQVVTVWSSRLGKTPNTCILLILDFVRIFEITHFF